MLFLALVMPKVVHISYTSFLVLHYQMLQQNLLFIVLSGAKKKIASQSRNYISTLLTTQPDHCFGGPFVPIFVGCCSVTPGPAEPTFCTNDRKNLPIFSYLCITYLTINLSNIDVTSFHLPCRCSVDVRLSE